MASRGLDMAEVMTKTYNGLKVPEGEKIKFADGKPMLAIPYYARANRGGRYAVWIRDGARIDAEKIVQFRKLIQGIGVYKADIGSYPPNLNALLYPPADARLAVPGLIHTPPRYPPRS